MRLQQHPLQQQPVCQQRGAMLHWGAAHSPVLMQAHPVRWTQQQMPHQAGAATWAQVCQP
jgi:hypothetical protein